MEKKLKIALCILVIVLISVIAFLGVYKKDVISYKGILPEYTLDSELKGKRLTYFGLSDETEEKIYDNEGNEVSEIPEGANEEDYTRENVKINLDEALTEENFKMVKKIFDGRLNEIGVSDYLVRLDNESGDVVVELDDNINTNTFLQYLLYKGDFSITDADDKTVLLDKNDVDKASVVYSNIGVGEVAVYLDIKFNRNGAKKLEEISEKYLEVKPSNEESNTTSDETNEMNENNVAESETEETTEEQKKVALTIEGSTLMTTYFGEKITNGELTINLGTGKDNDAVVNLARQAGILAMLINNGENPLTYEIKSSEYFNSKISGNTLYGIIVLLIAVALLAVIYLIYKYKVDGLYAGLSLIGGFGILLLLLRYTTTTISLGSFAAIFVLLAVEIYIILSILNNIIKDPSTDNTIEITKTIYLKKIDIIIILLIIAVVFTFMKEVKIYSIGMTLFYGIISLAIANFTFLRTLLIENHKEMK